MQLFQSRQHKKSKAAMQQMLSYGLPVAELKVAVQKQLDDQIAL
jgi:hypothetical protein